MKTAETINIVCAELKITKAELAKRMGMLPSSLYRKLTRESMTFEELQKCLDVLGVTIAFNLQYPNGKVQNSQANHEILLERMELLEKELEAARKAAEFHEKSLRALRTELNSAVGYTELGMRHGSDAAEYLGRIQLVLTNMELAIACALGEPANEEPDAGEPESIAMLAGERVLLVDDNELNRAVLKEILVDHGLIVEEAGNGSEAVAAVKEKEPGYYHFILMDIEMPVMNGLEATKAIRTMQNRPDARTIPIVAMTANAFAEDVQASLDAGMNGHLAKPIVMDEVIKTIERNVNR